MLNRASDLRVMPFEMEPQKLQSLPRIACVLGTYPTGCAFRPTSGSATGTAAGPFLKEARHLPKWDQTLSLIWFESEEIPSARVSKEERRWEYEGRDTEHRRDAGDDDGLKELDGGLRWNRKDRYR